MSTLLLPIPPFTGRELPSKWTSRILVAADGRVGADTAIAMAWTLGGKSSLNVISVLCTQTCCPLSEEERNEDRESSLDSGRRFRIGRVKAQLERVLDVVPDGDVAVESGSPPDVIASSARLRDATLLVTGLGTMPVRDRLLGDETTLAIARRVRTPLLAVARSVAPRPQRIVIGMDFSPASYSACDATLEIAGRDALVVLAYVQDANSRATPSGAIWRLAEKVRARFPGRVVAVERVGDPASELLDVAQEVSADTIAIGGHGQTDFRASALGPVATRIVRCSPSSVLLVPAS